MQEKISILLTLIICLMFPISAQGQQQIFVNYGVDNEGIQLFKFFYDVNDAFYVDIGAYDSIFASNTLNLQIMGWDGINIDANPQRLARFFYTRPWENSLNYAIGEQDQFVTLYELTQDSSSTISVNVKDYVAGSKPVVQQIKVPSLTMKQLCERFYYRRPIFMNLDIEGYGPRALQTNDWKNIKCVPEIIFSQINQQTRISGFKSPQQILKQHGYKKWKNIVGLNQIFILQSQYARYQKKYQQGTKIIQSKAIYPISYVTNFINSKLGIPSTNFIPHYSATKQSIYYYFAKNKQVIDVDKISKFSNKISQVTKDRPIVICNFNIVNSYIVLKNNYYSVQNFKIGISKFYHITIWRDVKQKYSVYIIDHLMKPDTNPKIIVTEVGQVIQPYIQIQHNNTLKQITEHPVNTTPTNTKILLQIKQLLNQSIAFTNKTNYNMQNRIRELSMTLLTNHYYDKAQFQKILAQVQKLQKIIADNKASPQIQVYQNQMNNMESLILESIKLQVGILLAILVCLVVVNAVICTTQQPRSNHSRVSNINMRTEQIQNHTSQQQIRTPNKANKLESNKKDNQKQNQDQDQDSSDSQQVQK